MGLLEVDTWLCMRCRFAYSGCRNCRKLVTPEAFWLPRGAVIGMRIGAELHGGDASGSAGEPAVGVEAERKPEPA